MTLDKIKTGQSAVIVGINQMNENDKSGLAMRRRLLELGLVPSTVVTLMKKAPMGDPLEYRVRGSTLTLRRSDAASVCVKEGM